MIMEKKTEIQTTRVFLIGEKATLISVNLSPGSVEGAILLSGPDITPDPADVPYVEAGAVSRIGLATGEVMWVTSSVEEVKSALAWPTLKSRSTDQ